jgi:hypothetical protein
MNTSNYAALIQENLRAAFALGASELAVRLDAVQEDDALGFKAFGADCQLTPDKVWLAGHHDQGPRGVIVSLLARHARAETCIDEPWRAFRELPDSMPYVGAFRAHTELPLVPHVAALLAGWPAVVTAIGGSVMAQPVSGDAAAVVHALPKIHLCYLFYRPDDEFPANVTCLFAANAHRFLPTDALADVGEYTSRALIAAVA